MKAVTWGSGFYDFNNDGWEDLFVAGGNGNGGESVYPSAMFVNNQDGTFLDLSSLSGTEWMMAMSMPTAMFADFNNDGQMDILADGMMGMPSLFMNMGGNSNHWLQVKLVGTTSNRDAVGARVVANVGGAHMLRQVTNGAGFQGNSTLVQHFGLGSAIQVDSLIIRWPSGTIQTMTNIPADQKITVTEQ